MLNIFDDTEHPGDLLSKVILFRHLAEETRADPSLLPWPATESGGNQDGHVRTSWKTVSDQTWQYEVIWDDRDHLLESRYRVDGDKPVLVEARGRDPGLAFQGIILAVVSLIVWRIAGWWRRRRGQQSPNEANEVNE